MLTGCIIGYHNTKIGITFALLPVRFLAQNLSIVVHAFLEKRFAVSMNVPMNISLARTMLLLLLLLLLDCC